LSPRRVFSFFPPVDSRTDSSTLQRGLDNVISSLYKPDSLEASRVGVPETEPACTALISVPLKIFRLLVDTERGRSLGVPSEDIDPYPQGVTTDLAWPMQPEVFEFIISKLTVEQCVLKQGNIVGDINFDRLIRERVVFIDQRLAIVTILYGILPGHLSIGDADGYPTAAKRLHDLRMLTDLQDGVTIRCDLTRTVCL
jgi:hypothetical protein